MKNTTTYKVVIGCLITLLCNSLSAQHSNSSPSPAATLQETNKRMGQYLELRKLGYTEKEIFEDLGNANFLTKNYQTALFWYDKLKETNHQQLSTAYQKRYLYAQENMGSISPLGTTANTDWVAEVKADYHVKKSPLKAKEPALTNNRYNAFDFNQENKRFLESQLQGENSFVASKGKALKDEHKYKTPIALTVDGKTAYFSKPIHIKPLYGILSKKEIVHKIYRADKINGQWKNIEEVAVCPKYSSAMHPAISEDGERLFFASDMPGTFGKYDIYVSAIRKDGTIGIAKNLGQKVNTKKNDLYPSIAGGNTLFFASAGREGFGGLDVYMTQVGRKRVGLAINLGDPINSREDDFAISLMTDKGMGYVMSNRGKNKNSVQRVAFSYAKDKKTTAEENREYNLLAAFNSDVKIDYTSSVFEDE